MSELKWDDLPIEIQEKMLEHQEAQGNEKDPEVFRSYLRACGNGVKWRDTPEGHGFWDDILVNGNLNLFYEKYPKKETSGPEKPEEPAVPQKLYKITLQGMMYSSTGPVYGESYVVAGDPNEAYQKVRKFLDENDIGFRQDREFKSAELIAENYRYTDAGYILHL